MFLIFMILAIAFAIFSVVCKILAAAFEIAVPFMVISIIVALFNILMCIVWF